MDTGIIRSIEKRRRALYSHYDLPPEERDRVESLFARMEQFGRVCRDREEFERGLATRTMSNEYNSLFVEFTAYVKDPEMRLVRPP